MATIREKGPSQWHVQIRKKGWPTQTKTCRTEREAQDWATVTEADMIRGVHVDHTDAQRVTYGEIVERYLKNVTAKRPGEESRTAEESRLRRFLREERDMCSYAVGRMTWWHWEQWRDRRLKETVTRGQPGGRGQYKQVEHKPKLRADGTPRANAAKPKASPKPPKTISPGTVKRELTLHKRVFDYSMKHLNLTVNPLISALVERPAVGDERDIRLEDDKIDRLIHECNKAKNPYVGPLVDIAFESGSRRGNLLRLVWVDVDLELRTAILRRVKNSRRPDEKRDIKIGLSPRAVSLLKELPRKEGEARVFPLSVHALKSAFERARVRAGVEHFRLHDARHERVSSLVEAGWSDSEIMAQTGQLDHKSLHRYSTIRQTFLAGKLAELPDRKRRNYEED